MIEVRRRVNRRDTRRRRIGRVHVTRHHRHRMITAMRAGMIDATMTGSIAARHRQIIARVGLRRVNPLGMRRRPAITAMPGVIRVMTGLRRRPTLAPRAAILITTGLRRRAIIAKDAATSRFTTAARRQNTPP